MSKFPWSGRECRKKAWHQLNTSVAVLKFFAELVDEEEVESFHEQAKGVYGANKFGGEVSCTSEVI